MAEEQKSQTFVETNKAVAAGIASVLVAVFTSKLGIAGTLIGTALAAVGITLISAILKAQLEKASHRVAGLPSTVRGRLSTQQVRIPGKQGPEPNPEPAARPEAAGSRFSGLLSRLRALPGFFRDLPSVQKRRVLLGGILAGLVAAVIGLVGVTGIELAGGKDLSCLVWSECSTEDTDSEGSSRGSGLSIFGGYSRSGTQSVPDQQITPGNNQQAPQQPAGQPARPGVDNGVPQQQPGGTPQQPDGTPKQGADQARPDAEPDAGGEVEPAPLPSSEAPEKGQSRESEDGQQ